ncbi:MAG TPA: hypothetical protein PLI51_04630 [bacterium]|nr:hypothetical protein [bacterium]HPQ65996.1 hypothetical protein [bacterium]
MIRNVILPILAAITFWLGVQPAYPESETVLAGDFFFSPGCRECRETREFVAGLADKYGLTLDLTDRDITSQEGMELLWAWEDRTGKTSDDPTALAVGGHFLAGEDDVRNNLEDLILSGEFLDKAPPPERERTAEEEFSLFAPGTVAAAGLIDGINPCAFTVMVMLISFLTVTGGTRSAVLRAGLSFSLGVFLTYLLIGAGLFGVVLQSARYRTLADVIYLLVGVGSVALGLITLRDAAAVYRSRELSKARLRLPDQFLRRIQRVLSGKLTSPRLIASAFVTGFLVSLLELVCTGQVYLPTIIMIMKKPALRAHAFAYLLLYCLAFIFPLVAVFSITYWGSGRIRLGEWSSRWAWLLKLLTGLLFLALGAFLLVNF